MIYQSVILLVIVKLTKIFPIWLATKGYAFILGPNPYLYECLQDQALYSIQIC